MEEGLINQTELEEVDRTWISSIICLFVIICSGVVLFVVIDYLFAKKIWI
jgi:hypothetical protein